MVTRETLVAIAREALGIIGLSLIVAGVWGRFGWEWGAIAAGLPFAVFYLRGEWRSASAPRLEG